MFEIFAISFMVAGAVLITVMTVGAFVFSDRELSRWDYR